MTETVKLIVGLGNPGQEYDRTRHNAGADFVFELARQYSTTLVPDSKAFGLTARITIGSRDVGLLVPTTYMNRSGQSVGAMCNFFKIEPESILVAHDELDLAPGVARLKVGGGHGGHNGLRDIISALANNKNFQRLRIGIGHPGNASQVSGYVLKRAPQAEQQLIDDAIADSLRQIRAIVDGDMEAAMRELHTKK
ncbi:aminoacyl-tRNA hydrolase [Simiduia agarivorans]|uniref:Peptidyl-tRNA hydrolase n=1 Tax=Simiduia agarivorans (strain DSM 21679 / JCM 13881 / BCRC 17597 / SA1) TaxID=1117647 RepID=K4KLF1_SIMAS|nr:aminoacyl-tRNA hydrolase [Simiduia agarivorans]AFU99050.1 peptidyl-tRNA hydrolase [Simiduia agarivorans SA1 = DSM 21679]